MNPIRAVMQRSQLPALLADSKGKTTAILVTSVVSGVAEATLLAIIAQVAVAISAGTDAVEVDVGGLPRLEDVDIRLLLVVALALGVGRLLLHVLTAWLAASLSTDAQARLRSNLLARYLRAGWPAKAREREGRLQELLTTQVDRASGAALIAATGLAAFAIFVVLVVAALVVNPLAALLIGATACVLFVGLRPVGAWTNRESARHRSAHGTYAEATSELVRLGKEVEVFDAGDSVRGHAADLGRAVHRPFLLTQFAVTLLPGVYQSAVILLVVIGLVGLRVSNAAGAAALGTVVLLLVRALGYSQQAQHAYQRLREVSPFVKVVYEAEARYQAAAVPDGRRTLKGIEEIALDKVSLAYVPGRLALQGVTAVVGAGEAIGIVGPSGAGKSTLLDVLLRLREPSGGHYRVNGIEVSEIRRRDWWRTLGFVPQDTQLLTGTVAENIRFFRPSIDDRDVEAAARLAYVHDDILSWPEGYATVVSQRNDALSGGQRQRLCLARALADKPEMLVLDEPTSAVDVRSEQLIQESLASLKGRVTLFVVAHRLALLGFCDRIMVLREGQMVAFDSATEFRRQEGRIRSPALRGTHVEQGRPTQGAERHVEPS